MKIVSSFEEEGVALKNSGNEITLKGYPGFVFRKDEYTNKYSIGSTEPFVDNVIYSLNPLETWVANYVVVRIGEFYYLADKDGNCYHQSKGPFIICRNLFVTHDKKFVINNKMNVYHVEALVKEYGGYNFAFKSTTNVDKGVEYNQLLDVSGKSIEVKTEYKGVLPYSCEEIHDWIIIISSEDENHDDVYFVSKEFELYYSGREFDEFKERLVGKKSQTYGVRWSGKDYYSTYVGGLVNFYQFQELEIVVFEGKTYFFKPDGTIEVIDRITSKPKLSGKIIVYYFDSKMQMRDVSTGVTVETQDLKPSELYAMIALDELIRGR